MDLFASLIAGDLLVEARGSPARLRLDWTGKSNARRPAVMLAPYFEAVLRRAKSSQCVIELHFEQLEFFNSSTLGAVIKFIREARQEGVAISLLFDGAQRWQALSFEALKAFELPDGLVQICLVRPVIQ